MSKKLQFIGYSRTEVRDTKSIYAMSTEKELNEAILKKTLMIQEKFPELSKYIEEMPITIPVDNPEITIKNLTNYLDSLENIIEKYAENH
jgi:hypothetical protein